MSFIHLANNQHPTIMTKEKSDQKRLQYHKQIAKRSFETLFNQYLFFRVSRGLQHKISLDDFKNFKANVDIIGEYVNEYWQKDYDYNKGGKWVSTIKDIETIIYAWLKSDAGKLIFKNCENFYVKERFEKVYPFDDFLRLFEKVTCYYCGISEDDIKELINNNKIFKKKVTRGWTLEIDRKKPNLEYTQDNCVRCCYWCNSAKTDEFDDIEFQPIGEAIKQIWHDRLNR